MPSNSLALSLCIVLVVQEPSAAGIMFACFFMFDAVTDVADSIVLLFLLLPLLSQI